MEKITKRLKNDLQDKISNWVLLIIILGTILIMPLFSMVFGSDVFNLGLTVIIMTSVVATSEKSFSGAFLQVVIAILALWVVRIVDIDRLNYISKLVLVAFFLRQVMRFISNVSKKKHVNSLVMIEAINGYLLLGIGFGMLIGFVTMSYAGSFNFAYSGAESEFYDPYYYAFVTMSTLGYGDFLPQTPPAKAISIFITLCGQIYLVTIMAFLIGKMLSQKQEDKS